MTEEQIQARKTLSRFALGLGVLGGVLVLFGIYFLFAANQSLSWPSVEGRVAWTEVKTEETRGTSKTRLSTIVEYYVSVQYKYEVEGETYFASRYSLGEGDRASDLYSERSIAEEEATRLFPIESSLTVYYDPDNPSSAILAPGWNWGTFAPLLIGIFLGGAGGLFYYILKKATVSSES